MTPILQLDSVSGGYLPGRYVLHQLSFSVAPGQMLGLIGLNGAGKSTTIKHILGLLKAQKGTIRINGMTLQDSPREYRSSFAFVPETPELYEELTVAEHFRMTAMAYGIGEKTMDARLQPLLEQFRMTDKLHSFPGHLSKGMKQKVMLINAFLIEPPLYIIDEPFLGLDPLGIRSLLDRMDRLREAGASFLISSHILSTIEQYCDRFVVLHQGRIAAAGTLEEIAVLGNRPGGSLDDIFYSLVKDDV